MSYTTILITSPNMVLVLRTSLHITSSLPLSSSSNLQHYLFIKNCGPTPPNTLFRSLQSRDVCINNIPVCSLPKSITAGNRLEVMMLKITSGPAPPRNPACSGTRTDPITEASLSWICNVLTGKLWCWLFVVIHKVLIIPLIAKKKNIWSWLAGILPN